MAKPKIALVGCGAVAQLHQMVVDQTGRAEIAAFCDKNLERAKELASKRPGALATDDYRELIGKVDAAIVALPHHLHAPIGSELLRGGVHVLVEKPMAMSVAECDQMIEAAAFSGATLAVGVARRFYDASFVVKELLDNGAIGKLVSFEGRDGAVYSWPVASDFMFRKDAGGGVLADTGAHVLDRLVYWLGDHESVTYYHDADGGVEAECELHLTMQGGAKGVVTLSRLRDLDNRWILRGEKGEIEVETKFAPKVTLRMGGKPYALGDEVQRDTGLAEDPLDCFCGSFNEFVDAFEQGRAPIHSGKEGRRSVALIEACQANPHQLQRDWEAWSA